jgi:hypothetical protein
MGRPYAACKDQDQRGHFPRSERLAQHDHPGQQCDRGVDVGEDQGARGSDLADEGEEHQEGEGCADHRQAGQRQQHPRRRHFGQPCHRGRSRVHQGGEPQARGGHRQRGHIREVAGRDQRSDGVARGHQQHLDDRPGAAACQMRTCEHGHPAQSDSETEYSPEPEALLAAGEPIEDGRDDRRGGDQQTRHRTGQVALGIREQEPRGDDFEEGEPQQGFPMLADDRGHTTRQRERQENRRTDGSSRKH